MEMMQSSRREEDAVVDIFCTCEHPYLTRGRPCHSHGSETMGSSTRPCSCHEFSFTQGYTCSPHEPRVKMTDLKIQKDGPFLRESNVIMPINGSDFGEMISGCCGQKKCGQEIMSLCSPQKS